MRRTLAPARRLTLSALGDSQTDAATAWTYCRADQKWPEALAAALRASPYGLPIKARNFGVSGDTSANNLTRCDVLQQWEIPDLAAIYIGVNDPGASISTAQTQANIQAIVKCLKYGVVGLAAGIGSQTTNVAGQANLPANAPPMTRMVVMADTSTTGGLASIGAQQSARISGNFSASSQQTVWERRTPQAGELGWGRVAIAGTAPFAGCCARICVVSTNYLNYPSGDGGDNVNVATGNGFTYGTSTDSGSAGTFFASYQTVRGAQLAAVNAENVNDTSCLYVDLFSFESGLILAGEATEGSNTWHWATANQHHNAYGHDIVARAIIASMAANRPAWLTQLAAL